MKNKIIVLTPPLNLLHGVSLHYKGLYNDWSENVVYFETFKIEKRSLLNLIMYSANLLIFLFKLILFKPDLVVINVSLKKGFYSKNKYIRVVKAVSKSRIIVFIHGWDIGSEGMLTEPKGNFLLKKADSIIVLANEFKLKLIQAGYHRKIFLATTKVDINLLKDFDSNRKRNSIRIFLFVSRVEKYKGIYEAIDLFVNIKKAYDKVRLLIVGDGTELQNVKNYVHENRFNNIEFLGRLSGHELAQKYNESDILLLPSYSEGFPAVVIEAMAFGLIIATTPVGGIIDFFNNRMGVFLDQTNSRENTDRIKKIMDDKELINAISNFNFSYSRSNFLSSKVADNLEHIFRETLK